MSPIPCDATVWMANGLPGIVIGNGHGVVHVLWPNGRATRVLRSAVMHWMVFP